MAMNWHRQFGTEDRLIKSIDADKPIVLEHKPVKAVSGSVTLGELLRSKQSSTPSAQ